MATNAEDLEALRELRSAVIAQMTAMTADPQPDYTVGDQSFSYNAMWAMLDARLKALDETIQRRQGPFQVASRGRF